MKVNEWRPLLFTFWRYELPATYKVHTGLIQVTHEVVLFQRP